MLSTVQPHAVQARLQESLRLFRAGEFQAAIAGFQGLLHEDSSHSRAWHGLGVTYLQVGETDQAIEAIKRAISLDDTKAVFHNNLGVALLSQGGLHEAKNAFATAVSHDSQCADAVANLALVHAKLACPDEAVRLYREALALRPHHTDALFNLANLLLDQGEVDEAVGFYQKALEFGDKRADILNNLGRAFLDNSRFAEATACFERALAVDPHFGEAALNAGKAYSLQERIREAARAFEVASRLRPTKATWRLQRLGLCPTVFQSVAELDEYRADLEQRLDAALQRRVPIDIDELSTDGVVPSFNLAHHGRSNRRLLEKFASLFAPHIPKGNPSFAKGKRRVGFVVTAPHVGSFLRTQAGIVEHLDSKRFDAVVFCTDSAIAKLPKGIQRDDVQWIPFPRWLSEAAKTIAEASCDVLYFHKVSADPFGYLLPFARLAPVQCTSWATHFTSGVSEVDYYLSSALVETDHAADEYTEELIRFETFPSYEKRPVPISPSSRDDFGLPAHGGLYLCPQRLAKFHPAQDELFRQILEGDSTGTLVLLAGNNRAALDQLLGRFRKTLGSAAKRIVVLAPQSSVKLQQLMAVCDALLDICHYSVSLMAKDAFAVGLPIVTLPGRFKVERYTLGFYRKMGVLDLIAESAEGYVRLAHRLGNDADFRRAIQNRIRAASHLLFDDRQTVTEFERFAEEATPRQSR